MRVAAPVNVRSASSAFCFRVALMLNAAAFSSCSTLPASCFKAELIRAETMVSERSMSSES